MAEACFYLRKGTKDSAKDFTTKQPIYASCRLLKGKEQLVYSTGYKILPKYWDFEKTKVKNVTHVSNKDEINTYLLNLRELINKAVEIYGELVEPLNKNILKEFLDKSVESYKTKKDSEEPIKIGKYALNRYALTSDDLEATISNFLTPQPEAQTKLSLFEYIEQFIHEAETGYRLIDGVKRYAVRSIQRYRSTQKLLTDFQATYSRNLDFETVDLTFYKDFSSYMVTVKDYAPETMGKHITALKTFLREATEEGINQNLDYQKKTFKVVSKSSEESVNIALNEDELLEMYNLDLSANQRLERVRDLFIIGTKTGLRFSDFTDIKPENIREDKQGAYLEIIQFKTKRKVVIPIDATVKTILQKYNNVLPEAVSNQKFNDYIKEVAQLCTSLQGMEFLSYVKGGKNIEENVERWKMISSHTARRSMATNAYERGTPVLSIMAITSHSTEKAFMAYIKTSKRKQAEIFRGYQK
jgi:site-specific recombinase XerD